MDCTAAISPPPSIVIDRGKRGFAATSYNGVKFDLTAWRRGSGMMMGKQVGRAMSLPPCFFSLLCPCPVKQGLTEEAVCGVERLRADYSPGTGYSWHQFKSSQNYGKLFEGSDVFESPEEKKRAPRGVLPSVHKPLVSISVKCLMLTAYHQLWTCIASIATSDVINTRLTSLWEQADVETSVWSL